MHSLAIFGEVVGVIVGVLCLILLAFGLLAAFILNSSYNPFR